VLLNIDDIVTIITNVETVNPCMSCFVEFNIYIHIRNFKHTLTQKVYVKSCLRKAAPPSEP